MKCPLCRNRLTEYGDGRLGCHNDDCAMRGTTRERKTWMLFSRQVSRLTKDTRKGRDCEYPYCEHRGGKMCPCSAFEPKKGAKSGSNT